MTRAEIAKQKFLEGYNCTQAVLIAFADLIGLPEGTLNQIGSSLGGGVARLREVCGAALGMSVAAGLLYGPDRPGGKEKIEQYKLVQELMEKFRQKNGSYICRELLTGKGIVAECTPNAEQRTAEYYKKRPCPDLCALAAGVLEQYILEHGLPEKNQKKIL